MKINHNPVLDTTRAEEIYSKKDGVPVKYVCTSAKGQGVRYDDVFYRETPHPEFGNRYFALHRDDLWDGVTTVRIYDADWIEDETFGMFEHEGTWYYSRGRHDYVSNGSGVIDGGRAYVRGSLNVKLFKVKDGEFIPTD
jgi:hypothetical protein